MAEKNKDHLADALAALSAGHHNEPDAHDHVEPAPPPPAAPPRSAPPRPAAARPSAPTPSSPPRPATPAPAKPIAQARPAAPSAPMPKARPAATRPVAPAPPAAARPAAPAGPPRSNRPQAPAAPVAKNVAAQEASSGSEFPNQTADTGGDWIGAAPQDDDAMLAPAPDASAFAASSTPYKSPPRKPSSDLKPTLIPILLTSGLLLIVFGSLKFVLGPDSPYSNLPSWVTAMMFGMGALVLAFGVFTMLQVREQLARAAAKNK